MPEECSAECRGLFLSPSEDIAPYTPLTLTRKQQQQGATSNHSIRNGVDRSVFVPSEDIAPYTPPTLTGQQKQQGATLDHSKRNANGTQCSQAVTHPGTD